MAGAEKYLDHTKDRSKPIRIIHGPSHSSDECKVLGDLGSNYAKSSPTEDCGHDFANKKKLNRQQDNNAIVNHKLDEILLKGSNKVSVEAESHENIESELNENDLYQIYNMSIDEKK